MNSPFERQKALVFQVGLEHPAVDSDAAGDDRLRGVEVVDKAVVVLRGAGVLPVAEQQ